MDSKKPNTPNSKGAADKKAKSPIKTGSDETKVPIRGKTEKGSKPTIAGQKSEKSKSKASSNSNTSGKSNSAKSKAKSSTAKGKSKGVKTDTTMDSSEFKDTVASGAKGNQKNKMPPVKSNKNSGKSSSEKNTTPVDYELKGVSDIRRSFHKNEEPLYFISATNFNLLGADEWIKGFKFITYIECFDGLHPNVFSPKQEIPHDDFEGIEDINNYLLQHPEVQDYLKTRSVDGRSGKAMFLMFNEKTEELAEKLGLEIMFPKAEMRTFLDNKVNTNRIAERAGVACVPNVLSKVEDFEHLRKVSKHLGNELVIQTPFGDSGHTTFFISNEEEYQKYAEEIEAEDEVKIMKRIRCRGSAIEACVTRHGTIVAPLMTELVGFEELTPYEGGWCGNEIYPNAFTPELRQKAIENTQLFGDQLREEGYKGYFELDFLIDQDNGEIYLGELNPRVTGASSITNHAVFALADAPLFVFHILEWMDIEYELDIEAINKRWSNQANLDGWSQLIVKHTEDTIEYVTDSPKSGIWRMYDTGHIQFDRMDTHRRAVENENEAFFLRISKKGDYLYEGADMGILVTRGRMMTDDFRLNNRAKHWIKAIRSQFKSEMVEDKKKPKLSGSLTK
ncbi:biotin carboxylase [Gillisia hiemivivida]|uniref:Biotin carboxylase n=1 Tax=Gillisia hiemivivida TaxID=291190 RepID=A0A5C6ZP02_9FLAO|nr:biotin carboxylase [Gillisia hiemivivida]TXD91786.1 biotin carboxylase [Gillisia hiemivivida]